MKHASSALLVSAALLLGASAASAATLKSLTFDLSADQGVLAQSQSYASKGQTLTATAYDAYAAGQHQARAGAVPLTLDATSKGLGMAYTSAVASKDNETNEVSSTGIVPNLQAGTLVEHYGFIQIDVTGIKNLESLSFTPVYPTLDGLADGETWQVIGSNTPLSDATSGANAPGTVLIASGSSTGPVTLYTNNASSPLSQAYKYYDFISLVDPLGSKYLTHKVANDAFSIGAISATAAVPEPASWSLMILGVGGVGAALRRRRRMVAA